VFFVFSLELQRWIYFVLKRCNIFTVSRRFLVLSHLRSKTSHYTLQNWNYRERVRAKVVFWRKGGGKGRMDTWRVEILRYLERGGGGMRF
jgi:hypothetical protein